MHYSRTTIHLLQTCLRLIQQEFNIRIRLDDEQVIAMILAYSAQSKSDELKQASAKLSHSYITEQQESGNAKTIETGERVYRGQKVNTEKSTDNVAPTPTGRTIIYRGQRVSV